MFDMHNWLQRGDWRFKDSRNNCYHNDTNSTSPTWLTSLLNCSKCSFLKTVFMFTHLIFIFAIITSWNHIKFLQSRCQWFASMVKIVNLLSLQHGQGFYSLPPSSPLRGESIPCRPNWGTDIAASTPTRQWGWWMWLYAGSCLNPKDIAARTQTATIQITVSAKRTLPSVANLASNILSQAGRQICFIAFVSYLLHCTRFVLSSCFFARSLQSLYTINNTKRAVTKTGLPMTVLEMWWN